jgi:hypothetical protein
MESGNVITREMLADAGGLAYEYEVPKALKITKCKEQNTWPIGLPEQIVFFGTKVYKKTARELAKELGTTPRQISKMRAGRTNECKPLSWYEENRKSSTNSRRTCNRNRSFSPEHLPTGL